jgi:hypothetical protein
MELGKRGHSMKYSFMIFRKKVSISNFEVLSHFISSRLIYRDNAISSILSPPSA